MDVLLLSLVFPYPPNDGNRLPLYHYLRRLGRQVNYHLLTLAPPEEGALEEGRRMLRQWGVERVEVIEGGAGRSLAQVIQCLRHGRPWVNRFFNLELARRLEARLATGAYDAVHVEGVLAAQHLPSRPRQPVLLVARDCLSLHHRRRYQVTGERWQLAQSWKIEALERAVCRRCHRILAISPGDRAALAQFGGGVPVEVLANGVDMEYFTPTPEQEDPSTVVFTGAMDYPPNVDAMRYFTERIWPRVRQGHPAARLIVAGRDPAPEIQGLDGRQGVCVTGRVPDIRPWLGRAAVAISPLRYGTGLKNKLLEGAAMGKAMVATPVSLEGFGMQAGRDLLVAEDARTFGEHVVGLLADRASRVRLGRNARAVVERDYAWSVIGARLMAHYDELVYGQGGKDRV